MAAEVATAIVAASGAVVLAGVTYWFTKKSERDAELRREKLEHYKDFVASLSGIISGEGTVDGQRAFSRACNKLNLVAPQAVLAALQLFQQEMHTATGPVLTFAHPVTPLDGPTVQARICAHHLSPYLARRIA